MVDLKDMNNNIISNRWKKRYEALSREKKCKLDYLDNADISEYQLNVIKRKRAYPNVGDIFMINPRGEIYLYGIVVNNHITNNNGEELLFVLIFKKNIDIADKMSKGVKKEDILIPPAVVGKEYWTRGFFYNVNRYEDVIHIDSYGFYSIGKGKFYNEHGKELCSEPELLGTYGVSTIYGIAMEINQELIIEGLI